MKAVPVSVIAGLLVAASLAAFASAMIAIGGGIVTFIGTFVLISTMLSGGPLLVHDNAHEAVRAARSNLNSIRVSAEESCLPFVSHERSFRSHKSSMHSLPAILAYLVCLGTIPVAASLLGVAGFCRASGTAECRFKAGMRYVIVTCAIGQGFAASFAMPSALLTAALSLASAAIGGATVCVCVLVGEWRSEQAARRMTE